jgi:hypothetical protein
MKKPAGQQDGADKTGDENCQDKAQHGCEHKFEKLSHSDFLINNASIRKKYARANEVCLR